MKTIEITPWEQIRALLDGDTAAKLEEYVESLSPGELLRSLFRLSDDEQRALLTRISAASAADVIEDLPDAHAAELLDNLPPADAANIVEEIASDDQADILAEMAASDAQAILAEMADEGAADARRLLEYDPDTAGGLMQTEFIAYPGTHTARSVLEDMATREDEYAQYRAQFVHVVAGSGELIGILRLRDIVFRNPDVRLADIARQALTVGTEAMLDALEDFFDEHTFNAVPVVDSSHTILGIVRRRAVDEALAERSDGERLRQAGIVGGEEIRSMPLALRSRRRLSWLSINIVLNIIAASVIALYQDTLSAVIALAVFLPIVSDMSGCSGNQAVAVSLRELALGAIVPSDVFRVWRQEALVGIVNGLVLGALLAAAAFAWQGNPWLGAVIGGALALNTIVAVSIGGTVPLMLRSIGVDPALASGPVLTTITDMCGFALVLSLATVALPLLL